LVREQKDFVDIISRKISIVKNNSSLLVEVVKGKSILEAGLDAGLELPYSCQTGNCSVCRGKVTNGVVKQIIKKHEDLVEDEYQLCCTYPISENVQVVVL
jgi:ring-1,2-phenylacetyl-CoA epoxidase subunit PaaE